MIKLPHLPLYVNDWSRDLEEHPLEIEGAWLRIICKLWWDGGSGESIRPIEQWSKILRTFDEKTTEILKYIQANNIGNIEFSTNGDGKPMAKVICRRMKREWNIRRKRVIAGKKGANSRWQTDSKKKKMAKPMAKAWQNPDNDNDNDNSYNSSLKGKNKNARKERGKISLVLDKSPKRWEGITEEDRALWAKTYPGCDIERTLQEMIAYWDAQPKAALKINWKRTIVNRLAWVQDHGGTKGIISIDQKPESWLEMMERKEKEEKKNKNENR